MHYCAAQNFVEFIHDLAELGAPIDSADERGMLYFLWAIRIVHCNK